MQPRAGDEGFFHTKMSAFTAEFKVLRAMDRCRFVSPMTGGVLLQQGSSTE